MIWYDLMWHDTIRYETIRYNTILYNTIRYDMIRYDTIRYYMIWYDIILYEMIWYDTIWYDMILNHFLRIAIGGGFNFRFIKRVGLLWLLFGRQWMLCIFESRECLCRLWITTLHDCDSLSLIFSIFLYIRRIFSWCQVWVLMNQFCKHLLFSWYWNAKFYVLWHYRGRFLLNRVACSSNRIRIT